MFSTNMQPQQTFQYSSTGQDVNISMHGGRTSGTEKRKMNSNRAPDTFKSITDKLVNLNETNYGDQQHLFKELVDVFNKFKIGEKCDRILEVLLSYNVPVGGLMYRGKLILWTFYELINVTPRDITDYACWPEIFSSFNAIFKRVVFQSKKENKNELINIRHQLGNLLPADCLSCLDETGKKKFGPEWFNPMEVLGYYLPPPVNNQITQQRIETIQVNTDPHLVPNNVRPPAKNLPSALLPSCPPKIQNSIRHPAIFHPEIHHQGRTARQINSFTEVSSPPVFDIEEDPRPENYDHFGREMLFSPVSTPEQRECEDDISPPKKPRYIETPSAPNLNLEDFLKSCREESVRIRTEDIAKNLPSLPKSSSEKDKTPTKQKDDIKNEALRIKKKTEAIKQRTIKAFSSSSHSSNIQSSRTSSDKPSKPFKDPKDSKGGWAPSMIPSKPDKVGHAAYNPDKQKENIKNSKVFQDIKRKLQKTQVQSVVTVNGNIKEVLLPVNFTADEYVEQLFSSTFLSHGLKQLSGKYVVFVTHRLNPA